MAEKTYYIDPVAGNDSFDGLSPEQPFKTYRERSFQPGDFILFKRGTVLREGLHTCVGSAEGVITYGAYGTGPKPVFLGSASANGANAWIEEQPHIWRYTGPYLSEVCNLIFNHGESCGNLRWTLAELKQQGEWCTVERGLRATGLPLELSEGTPTPSLYLYSIGNPGKFYKDIECALWGDRRLVTGNRYLTLENLVFKNGGVHGYQAINVHHLTIRNCEFLFIGGGIYDAHERIRFGNGVEFWDGASDILVESCVFDKIYDSGVTHQGGLTVNIPERIVFRNNLFIDNGMSAYESREPGQEIYFEYNTCIRSGGGFSMQGETPPRMSEIYPEPMGHHVFIWRIDPGTQPGAVYIRYNIFWEAPYGAAIYSCIDPVDERKFVIDHNCYWQTTNDLLMKLNKRSYTVAEIQEYQTENGQDANSLLADPQFVDAARGDYRLAPNSPVKSWGIQDDCWPK